MFFTYWDDLGSTPARVNRFTGEIQINNRYFDNMPEFRKMFVIEHEKGHFLNNTRSEFEADQYAFKKLAGTQPRSLKESVYSISRVLSFRNPEHMERMIEMMKMALEYDFKHNGNEKAKTALEQLNSAIKTNNLNKFHMNNSIDNSYFAPNFGENDNDDIYDNARGRAKRQAKKAARVANRQAKRQTRVVAKVQRKQTRVDGKVAKKQTRKDARFSNRQRNQAARAENQAAQMAAQQEFFPVDEPVMDVPIMEQPDYSYPEETVAEYAEFPIEDVELEEENPDEETEEEMESFLGEDGVLDDDSYYDNGAGKASRQARRAKKQEAKQKKADLKNDKRAAKNNVIEARATSKITRANAKDKLASQGKSGSEWIGGAVDGVLGLFGKGKSADTTDPNYDPNAAPVVDDGSGKMLGMPKGVGIAVIIVVVLVVIGAIAFFVKRKKA